MANITFGNYSPCYCTDAQRAALQRNVENKCKGGVVKRCEEMDNCPALLSKIEEFGKCMNARIRINAICFKGGDTGHIKQVQQQIDGIVRCQKIASKKCESEPKKQPQPDREFMKKMEELTGLTGAALIIYLIISEGSRLFPPRNLIPIP